VASGEINAGMARALVPYADRPSVLARIEDDMLSNPWAWRTVDDFERNAKQLAEETGAKPKPAPTELKPMRATPRTGEHPRPSRAAESRELRAESQEPEAADPTADSRQPTAETSYVPTVEWAGAPPVDDEDLVHAPAAAAVADGPATPRFVVQKIVELVGQITSIADLDEIERAIDERRTALPWHAPADSPA
jgi:hypothetical protein